jgi:hypothetical protein
MLHVYTRKNHAVSQINKTRQSKQSVPGVKRHYYRHHSTTVHQMLQNTMPKKIMSPFAVYLYDTKLKNSGQLIFLGRARQKKNTWIT